jgi:hypothetical protein
MGFRTDDSAKLNRHAGSHLRSLVLTVVRVMWVVWLLVLVIVLIAAVPLRYAALTMPPEAAAPITIAGPLTSPEARALAEAGFTSERLFINDRELNGAA